jgi:hypothetical protein
MISHMGVSFGADELEGQKGQQVLVGRDHFGARKGSSLKDLSDMELLQEGCKEERPCRFALDASAIQLSDSDLLGWLGHRGRCWLTEKKGKIYLGYSDNGQAKKKSCRVTGWTMNPATGASTATFLVPKLPSGTYDLIISNKVGTAARAGGFTIP